MGAMVSIIIPVKNEASVIAETLKNLRAAENSVPIEIIVSNDGSTDGTKGIAAGLADRVVTKTTDDTGHTIAAARNRGASASKGDILLFLDADVFVPDPARLVRTFVAAFARDSRLLAATAFLKVLPDQATSADRIFSGLVNWFFLLLNLVSVGAGVGEMQAVRADAFREVGGYNHELAAGEDFDLFRRLAHRGRTRTIRSLTVYHTGRRVHAVGWPRLLSQWFLNALFIIFARRSFSKVWKEVR